MPDVVYSLTASLDGYVVGPDGRFDWAAPPPDVFALATDEVRGLGVHLLGRRLYETMEYWRDVDPASLDDAEREFAALWNALPKVVFSRTLTDVRGPARLATDDLATEVARLRDEVDGDIAIGGADLAHQAAGLGLIDEYRVRVLPVLVGGGTPYFAHDARQVPLRTVECRPYGGGVVYLRHRVVRAADDDA
ncbi:dihydrofolate reductase family protein [Cellulomonas sp. B6]|jgi:dihydrofolate reductase|uniref:dihydrofolate reductase family protein n=1 Tax=Cellulomonas sp. B6 TaxID=1295626 RepID=UPI00073D0C86|nr:dihydrofolate reductase family protein [Cellulomonas sp. B6]KSW19088.1 deaminase [Cellulomonas sp. B6]